MRPVQPPTDPVRLSERVISCIGSTARNVKKSPAGAGLLTRGLNFSRKPGCSVANLDARSIPNASIPIPNRGTSGPVAVRRHVHGSGRYVDGGRLIVAWAARYRRSKQCANGQAANDAGGYLTTACDRILGCNRQTKAACDEQADEKLSHFAPLRMEHHCLHRIKAKFMSAGLRRACVARKSIPLIGRQAGELTLFSHSVRHEAVLRHASRRLAVR